jgi:hypothetical protein
MTAQSASLSSRCGPPRNTSPCTCTSTSGFARAVVPARCVVGAALRGDERSRSSPSLRKISAGCAESPPPTGRRQQGIGAPVPEVALPPPSPGRPSRAPADQRCRLDVLGIRHSLRGPQNKTPDPRGAAPVHADERPAAPVEAEVRCAAEQRADPGGYLGPAT